MTFHRFRLPGVRLPLGVLTLAACAAMESGSAGASFIDTAQTLRIVADGGWYQEVVYNLSTNDVQGVTDPVNFDANVAYTLIVDHWIGVYHYDYTAAAYTTAFYRTDDVY